MIEYLVPQSGVEALNEGILPRRSRFNVVSFDSLSYKTDNVSGLVLLSETGSVLWGNAYLDVLIGSTEPSILIDSNNNFHSFVSIWKTLANDRKMDAWKGTLVHSNGIRIQVELTSRRIFLPWILASSKHLVTLSTTLEKEEVLSLANTKNGLWASTQIEHHFLDLLLPKKTLEPFSDEVDEFVINCAKILRENAASSSFSVEMFSSLLEISPRQLQRRLRSLTGMSPFEIISEYRLRLACMLLVNEQMQVKDVAVKIGFSSPEAFSRRFSQKYGVTPSDYATQQSLVWE